MNKENKKIYYLTYQDFPAQTANSQQTIATCKYFARNNFEVTLFFPLRSSASDSNFNNIKNFYSIKKDEFTTIGLKHKKNFENNYLFKKTNYVLTHALWAFKSVNKVLKEFEQPYTFFTRSDWVFFFLAFKNFNVVYECHQITKIRKFLIKKSIKKSGAKIIFLNENLRKRISINKADLNKILVQENGFDEDYFFNSENKKTNQVVFAGSLTRLGKERGLEEIITAFEDPSLHNFNLIIIGGSKGNILKLKDKYHKLKNVYFEEFKKKDDLAKVLASSEFAIMVNKKNEHSEFFTDPLKYYEYSASGLKIIASDFPAHRVFEKNKNITFFKPESVNSFISALIEAKNLEINTTVTTINQRINKIIEFI